MHGWQIALAFGVPVVIYFVIWLIVLWVRDGMAADRSAIPTERLDRQLSQAEEPANQRWTRTGSSPHRNPFRLRIHHSPEDNTAPPEPDDRRDKPATD